MLIDWFTVGAQGLNFLILLWLMKRFLYKPILNAIDARDKKIANQLAAANTKETEAKKESAEFASKNETFDKERAALLDKATADANKRHTELLNEARREIDELRAKQQEILRNEQRSLSKDIERRAQDEIFSIARKTLHDLADVSLEERICDVFIRQIREIRAEEKKVFIEALSTKKDSAVVRSTFEISSDQRTRLELAIKEVFGLTAPIRYESSSTLIAGIEFSTNGQKLSWSISNYLASLSKSVNEVLNLPVQIDDNKKPAELSSSDAP